MSVIEAVPEMGIDPIAEVAGLRDHCGVWAIWDPDSPAILEYANIGALNIQHRGEGGAGIAVISDSSDEIECFRGAGKVKQVFGEDGENLQILPPDAKAAIVHTRWPTDVATLVSESPVIEADCNQPRVESELALGHNGQLMNKEKLAETFGVADYASDTDLMTKVINKVAMECKGDVERAVLKVLPHLEGAFCVTILTQDKLIAFRDRHGIRPLQLGTTETGGYIVASENMAIDHVPGAKWEREVEPAEMIVIDKNGLRSGKWAEADPAICMMEYVYLANKDTMLGGIRVGDARRGFGRQLARYIMDMKPEDRPSVLVPIPNSANQAAHGLAEAASIPFVPALVVNPDFAYGRSFLQPDQLARLAMAGGKLMLNPDLDTIAKVRGKVVGAVDDSLIRSNTAKVNVPKIAAAGASETQFLVAAPMVTETCNYGVDTAVRSELIAARTGGDTAVISREIGTTRTIFLKVEDMQRVVGKKVCTACMGGERPSPIPRATDEDRFQELVYDLELAGATV